MRRRLFLLLLFLIGTLQVYAAPDGNAVAEQWRRQMKVPEHYALAELTQTESFIRIVYRGMESDTESGGEAYFLCDGNGELQTYSHYRFQNEEINYRLSSFDYEEAVRKGTLFLQRSLPSYADRTAPVLTENYLAKETESYEVVYRRMERGIPYNNHYVRMLISAEDGEVQYLDIVWDQQLSFPRDTGSLTAEEAKQAFSSLIGGSYCYIEEDGTAVLRLQSSQHGRHYLDAATGLPIHLFGAALRQDAPFTALLTETAHHGEMTEPEGDLLARSISQLGITRQDKLLQSRYMTDAEGETCLSLTYYRNGAVSAEAVFRCRSRELVAFRRYTAEAAGEAVAFAESRIQAETFAQKYLARHYADCVYREDERSGRGTAGDTHFFARVVNGIPYLSNGIYIRMATDGTLLQVETRWDQPVFESAEGAMPAEEWIASFAERYPPEKQYMMLSPGEIRAVYTLPPNTPQLFYAADGRAVGEKKMYRDISGHGAEEQIKTLLLAGILEDGDLFRPDDTVTVREFGEWVSAALGKDTEIDLPPEESLTREYALVVMVTQLGYGEAAVLENAYTTGFWDEGSITEKYLGHVAIAKGLGIVGGDVFRPQMALTRSQAASFLCNLLVN